MSNLPHLQSCCNWLRRASNCYQSKYTILIATTIKTQHLLSAREYRSFSGPRSYCQFNEFDLRRAVYREVAGQCSKRQGFSGLLRADEAQGAIYPRHPQSPSWPLHRLPEILPRRPGRSIELYLLLLAVALATAGIQKSHPSN